MEGKPEVELLESNKGDVHQADLGLWFRVLSNYTLCTCKLAVLCGSIGGFTQKSTTRRTFFFAGANKETHDQ